VRLFVAADVSEEVRAAIPLGKEDAFKWARREGLHLTLVFLGETTDAREAEVKTLCAEVAKKHRAFSLALEGAGTFGSPPKVLWLGITGDVEPLKALRAELSTALNVKDEHPDYAPHLTLARAKHRHGDRALDAVAQSLRPTRLGPFRVGELVLYQSAGGRYVVRARFPLV